MAGKVLTSMMLNMMRERKTTVHVRGAGIKSGRQRSYAEVVKRSTEETLNAPGCPWRTHLSQFAIAED